MARRVQYPGVKFAIVFAGEKNGACPAGDFFDGLSTLNKAKITALFKILGDHGRYFNPTKFGDLENGLFEFKSHQIRMPFAYAQNSRGEIVVTHGFVKQKDKTPKGEIDRAWRIFKEDQAHTKLGIVKKAKR